jgi:hypothetical protein
MATFKEGIAHILARFADELVHFVLAQSMGELVGAQAASPAPMKAPTSPKTEARPKYHRRTPEEIAEGASKVLAVLRKHPDGLRSEQIREAVGCEASELPRYLAELGSQIRSKGQKRGTTYFVKPATAAKKTAKKATAPKPAKKTAKDDKKAPEEAAPAPATPAVKAA